LDYYTGTVVETFLTKYPSQGSIFSGGRYDNLVADFSNQMIEGFGVSLGLTRLFDLILDWRKSENKIIDIKKILGRGVYISESFETNLAIGDQMNTLIEFLYKNKILQTYPKTSTLNNAYKYAENCFYKYLIFFDYKESLKDNKRFIKCKNIVDGTTPNADAKFFTIDEVIEFIKESEQKSIDEKHKN
jgi:histidyl-tRNA synthetase